MRVLVLGGTAWLGGHLAATAVASGHEVTCLARGTSGKVPLGTAFVSADRDQPGAYDTTAAARWDVVVDVSRQPGQLREAAAALVERSRLFVFVSSASVYADHRTVAQDEGAPLLEPLEGDVMASMETYGQAKVACEAHVLAAYGPGRALIARVGLIGGPGDTSDRSGYWPLRFSRPAAQDGRVLMPDAPEESAQIIDVRDLARWLVDAACQEVSGVFNVMGETMPLVDHLRVARTVAGHAGPVMSASSDWLSAHGVQPWAGERSLPLWIGDPEWTGHSARSSAKATAAGLVTRPLDRTLADTLVWELGRDGAHTRNAGLSDEDERALLDELARANT